MKRLQDCVRSFQYCVTDGRLSIDPCVLASMPLLHWGLRTETALFSWRKC